MKKIAVVMAAVVLCAGADDAKKDLDKLKGKWKLISAVRGGQEVEQLKDAEVYRSFDGDKWTLDFNGQEITGTFKIDASKKPKTIDSNFNGEDRLGIYEIDGDNLKLCNSEPGEDRPSEFKSEEGTRITLTTYKRVKDKK